MFIKYTILTPILLAFLSLSLVFGALPAHAQGAPSLSGESANVAGSRNATLSVFVNSNGGTTELHFKYWTGSIFKEKIYFGVSGTSRVEVGLINLLEGTTYSYQVFARNSYGSTTGSTNTFTTYGNSGSGNFSDSNNTNTSSGSGINTSSSQGAPLVATNGPASVSTNSAVINGSVNPNGALTTFWFEFGTTQILSQTTTIQSAGSGSSWLLVTGNLSGLENGKTYYYRTVAQNVYGVNRGEVKSFTTGANGSGLSQSSSSGQGQVLGAVSGNGNGNGSQASTSTATSGNVETSINSGVNQVNQRPSFISLEYSLADEGALVVEADNAKPKPGEEFSYTIVYKNDGTSSFNETALKAIVPIEADFVSASIEQVRVSGNVVEFNLGHISPGSRGSVIVVVKVKETTKSGANIIFTSVLGYKDRLGTQLATTSYLTAIVEELDSGEQVSLLGFLSDSASTWLVVLGLIVLIALLAYKFVSMRNGRNQDKEKDIYGFVGIPPTFEKIDPPMGRSDIFQPVK